MMDSPGWESFYFTDSSNTIVVPEDEKNVEFTVDTDEIGVRDFSGHTDLMANLVDDWSHGLVLVTEHGSGIVWDDDYTKKEPLELVNIAGYMNAVSYGLNDAKSRTTAEAHMIVPGSLFGPAAFFDTCYIPSGDPIAADESNCELWWSIAGGSPEPVPAVGLGVKYAPKIHYAALFEETDYTGSALVVSGRGPDTVTDMDGDGDIDDLDLELMGYEVLGKKTSVTFKQVAGSDCFGPIGRNLLIADLDNNGLIGILDVCGPGSGSLSRPPW
jgi:hypothetical protein